MKIRDLFQLWRDKDHIDRLLDEVNERTELITKRMTFLPILRKMRFQAIANGNHWASAFFDRTEKGLNIWIENELHAIEGSLREARNTLEVWEKK